MFSCTNTGDQFGSPSCLTEGADHTQGNTPEPGMGGTEERRTLGQEWRGTNIRRAICRGWRGLNNDVKNGKTTWGAHIQNTPPLQALVGVRVVAPLLGHSRITYDFSSCFSAKFQNNALSEARNQTVHSSTVVFMFSQIFITIMLPLKLEPQINCQQLPRTRVSDSQPPCAIKNRQKVQNVFPIWKQSKGMSVFPRWIPCC